jgi:chromate transport protein ChrA
MLTFLFAARVAAQALQRWLPVPFLPPFGAFQGSALPYAILLPAQLAILALMSRIVWRTHKSALRRRPRASRILAILGCIYFAAMLARLLIGLIVPGAPVWFRTPISALFHLVLATFVVVLAAYHGQIPQRARDATTP